MISQSVRRLSLFAAAFTVAVVFASAEAGAETSTSSDTVTQAAPQALVVNCHDTAHNIVEKKRRDECRGRIVTDAEAAKIDASRRQYVLKVLSSQLKPIAPGMTLTTVGSGFFVNRRGMVLTSYRIVDGCSLISVSSTAGDTVPAELIATDAGEDLALLRSDVAPPGVANFSSSEAPETSEEVAVVGYPDEGVPPSEPLLTTRTARAGRDGESGRRFIELDSDIRSGNAGGPVLDQLGNVIGVAYAEPKRSGDVQTTENKVNGVGLAISGRNALSFLEAQQVDFRRVLTRPVAIPSEILKHAKLYVAQVGCWN